MFISFEGIEGSGKTTLIENLAAWLDARGAKPFCTREPGSGSLGKTIRSILLNQENYNIDPTAELFLFLADRAQHIAEEIQPALKRNQPVLCDRFTESTLAYQGGGRGLNLKELGLLCNAAMRDCKPDHVVLLDLPVETGLARAARRNRALDSKELKFDLETHAFHERVRQTYLELAKADPRFVILDATLPEQEILNNCIAALNLNHN